MLITLSDLKARMGITGTTEDAYLTAQIKAVTMMINNIVGYNLEETSYEEIGRCPVSQQGKLYLSRYPLTEINHLIIGGTEVVQLGSGVTQTSLASAATGSGTETDRWNPYNYPFDDNGLFEFKSGKIASDKCRANVPFRAVYKAGYKTAPSDIAELMYDLIEGRHANKGTAGSGPVGALKSERVDGVVTASYYDPASGDDAPTSGFALGSHGPMDILERYTIDVEVLGGYERILNEGVAAPPTGTGTGMPTADSPTQTFEAASQAAMLALTGVNQGDIVVRKDSGNTYINLAGNNASMTDWKQISSALPPATRDGETLLARGATFTWTADDPDAGRY